MLVASCQELVGVELVAFVEKHGLIRHVVDVGAHLVHAVGWLNGDDIIDLRSAKYPVNQVYGFVRAIAQEDAFRFNLLILRELCLDFRL